MALLTREERKLLTRAERRELRKERRRDRLGTPFSIHWPSLEDEAEALILGVAHAGGMSGPDKMDDVISELAERMDEWLVWEGIGGAGPLGPVIAVLLEAADGPVIHLLLRILRRHVQRVHDRLVEEGRI